MRKTIAALLLISSSVGFAADPDWSRNADLSNGPRLNPYQLSPLEFERQIREGRLHALHYPVTATELLIPYDATKRFVEAGSDNFLRRILQSLFGDISGIDSLDAFQSRFGLLTYPKEEGTGPYFIPVKEGLPKDHRMGFTVVDFGHSRGITVSCAQCHTSDLFGRKVMGLTNRFPHANEMFVNAISAAPHISSGLFKAGTGASQAEVEMFKATKHALEFVGAKKPVQLGLDTSLAQVAISLAHRAQDPWATRIENKKPRKEALEKYVADSKPAVWWNVKYKNRWLSDGSIVSGNPILTNFLWNEIGRGTDLKKLDDWMAKNEKQIEELTTAVFSTEAPRFTDFFPAPDLESAKRGQVVFRNTCVKCHGDYEKMWEIPGAEALPTVDQIETTKVTYTNKVVNVGTDPQRYIGMRALVQLNGLEISKRNGIVVEHQEGYVPPPLVGIWARWPYFHNNSAPSLCAVLSPTKQRPVKYWAREAKDKSKDFDLECNGYPSAKPDNAHGDFEYDTRKLGLKNAGHDEGIFAKNGVSVFTKEQRRDLIRFLQTL